MWGEFVSCISMICIYILQLSLSWFIEDCVIIDRDTRGTYDLTTLSLDYVLPYSMQT